MTFIVVTVCLAALFYQYRDHEHQKEMRTRRTCLLELAERVAALEVRRAVEFDPTAFEDLKNKVDALRIAQGLKGR